MGRVEERREARRKEKTVGNEGGGIKGQKGSERTGGKWREEEKKQGKGKKKV